MIINEILDIKNIAKANKFIGQMLKITLNFVIIYLFA